MKNTWTYKELDILRREFPHTDNRELARRMGRTPGALAMKACKLGLKKDHQGIQWTPQMLKTLTDFFPIMFNRPLAKWLGVSQRTMLRKARELGLSKPDDFLETRRKDINRMAGEALRARGDREGTWFKKGVRSYPPGEFKPGRKEDPETTAKRIAARTATMKRRKELKRLGIESC